MIKSLPIGFCSLFRHVPAGGLPGFSDRYRSEWKQVIYEKYAGYANLNRQHFASIITQDSILPPMESNLPLLVVVTLLSRV